MTSQAYFSSNPAHDMYENLQIWSNGSSAQPFLMSAFCIFLLLYYPLCYSFYECVDYYRNKWNNVILWLDVSGGECYVWYPSLVQNASTSATVKTNVPVDNREQLYCIVQQYQMKCICFYSYVSNLFSSFNSLGPWQAKGTEGFRVQSWNVV